jgi:hypothetical protein
MATPMRVPGITPISAEPILGLVRAHARRTSLGRLGVVYEIVPSPSSRPALGSTSHPALAACEPSKLGKGGENVALRAKSKVQALLPLGQALYMDSIIEGGIDGEQLPVTLDRGVELNMQAHMPGGLVNLEG